MPLFQLFVGETTLYPSESCAKYDRGGGRALSIQFSEELCRTERPCRCDFALRWQSGKLVLGSRYKRERKQHRLQIGVSRGLIKNT